VRGGKGAEGCLAAYPERSEGSRDGTPGRPDHNAGLGLYYVPNTVRDLGTPKTCTQQIP